MAYNPSGEIIHSAQTPTEIEVKRLTDTWQEKGMLSYQDIAALRLLRGNKPGVGDREYSNPYDQLFAEIDRAPLPPLTLNGVDYLVYGVRAEGNSSSQDQLVAYHPTEKVFLRIVCPNIRLKLFIPQFRETLSAALHRDARFKKGSFSDRVEGDSDLLFVKVEPNGTEDERAMLATVERDARAKLNLLAQKAKAMKIEEHGFALNPDDAHVLRQRDFQLGEQEFAQQFSQILTAVRTRKAMLCSHTVGETLPLHQAKLLQGELHTHQQQLRDYLLLRLRQADVTIDDLALTQADFVDILSLLSDKS